MKKISWFGRGLCVLVLLATVFAPAACKKAEEGPQTVTFIISVYNHMKAGVQRTLTKDGLLNSSITLTFAEAAIEGVSALYMAAREPNIGKLLGTTTNGTLTIRTTDSTGIDVFCFSLDGVSEAYFQEIWNQGPKLICGRNSKFYRRNFDGYTPNNEFQAEWDHAFNEVNSAFQNPYPVGSTSPIGGSSSDWSYGCGHSPASGDKKFDIKAILVNNKNLDDDSNSIKKVAIEELWEVIGRIDDIGPVGAILNGVNLSTAGKNLGRFYMIMFEP